MREFALNGMRGLTPNPTKMEDPLLQELLQIVDSGAPKNLGAATCNSCPATVTMEECRESCELLHSCSSFGVRPAEESYLDHPY